MKLLIHYRPIALLILSVLLLSCSSYAAFPIRDSNSETIAQWYPVRNPHVEKAPKIYKHDKKGKQKIFGYLSLFCATTFVLSPLAIVFGAIGCSRNRGARRMAGVGLGLGCIEFALIFLPLVFLMILLL